MPRLMPCDVCRAPRKRWQRLCDTCYGRLPPSHRYAIKDAWQRNDGPGHRAARKAAAAFLADQAHAHVRACAASVSPQRAAELAARITGERDV